MKRQSTYLFILASGLTACSTDATTDTDLVERTVQVHGHRGHRGVVPPGNTLPSFQSGLDAGVHVLEGDMRNTADGVVVFAHEDDLRTIPCTWAGPDEAPGHKVTLLNADQVAAWDCHPELDGVQAPPTLQQVLELSDTVTFSLELKRQNTVDTDTSMKALVAYNTACDGCLAGRLIVQSFGWEFVQHAAQAYGAEADGGVAFEGALLGGHETTDFAGAAAYASVWSPDKAVLTEAGVQAAHAAGFLVVPWTLNETAAMQEAIDIGVDGIITDHPEVLLPLLGQQP